MRVIGGIHRGRTLRTAAGMNVRPTSDRLRETLFNILAPRIAGSSFLDICAGSGAVGIEALSRGASAALFIERSREACASIGANLSSLGIDPRGMIVNREATAALKNLDRDAKRFDIIFFDPPYASQLYYRVMTHLGGGSLLAVGGIAIVEHRAKTPPAPEYEKLRIFREVKQGESRLAFYAASPV